MYGGCRIYPNDNPWNTDISKAPLDPELNGKVNMVPAKGMHPDWGTMTDNYGIPINSGPPGTPVPITWTTNYGPRESDKLPCPTGNNQFCYPIPLTAKIEGGPGAPADADRHIVFLSTDGAPDKCTLYELYQVANPSGGGFRAASGAIFKLESNALRTEGWTSADAAGLPILPGLVRFDEIKAGVITHALRYTMVRTRHAFIHPATHAAGDQDDTLPPMGMRIRLKASFDDSTFSAASKVIVKAMKTYGLILADNGSDWYFTGESNNAWEPEMDKLLQNFSKVKGSDFEIVKTGDVIPQPD